MDANRATFALYERARNALPARPVFARAPADAALNRAVVKAALLFNYGVDP
jgi:hypothetical protein